MDTDTNFPYTEMMIAKYQRNLCWLCYFIAQPTYNSSQYLAPTPIQFE